MYRDEERTHTRKKLLRDVICEVFRHGSICKCIDARIVNVSATGACVETEKITEPGTILNLSSHQEGAEAAARVQGPAMVRWVSPSWSSQAKGRFKIGLQFLA